MRISVRATGCRHAAPAIQPLARGSAEASAQTSSSCHAGIISPRASPISAAYHCKSLGQYVREFDPRPQEVGPDQSPDSRSTRNRLLTITSLSMRHCPRYAVPSSHSRRLRTTNSPTHTTSDQHTRACLAHFAPVLVTRRHLIPFSLPAPSAHRAHTPDDGPCQPCHSLIEAGLSFPAPGSSFLSSGFSFLLPGLSFLAPGFSFLRPS